MLSLSLSMYEQMMSLSMYEQIGLHGSSLDASMHQDVLENHVELTHASRCDQSLGCKHPNASQDVSSAVIYIHGRR